MVLVFGGAYQGKRTYVLREYGLKESDIFTCTGCDIDKNARVIAGLENFSAACVNDGKEPIEVLRGIFDLDNCDRIFVSRDVSCGIVPVDPVLREWREAHSRMMNTISDKADRVVRLFCSLPQVLK